MSAAQPARIKILKPSGFVFLAHACALCAKAFVMEAVFLVQEASACEFEAAHRKFCCRMFFVQAGPSLN